MHTALCIVSPTWIWRVEGLYKDIHTSQHTNLPTAYTPSSFHSPRVIYLSTLSRHTQAVNVVRFSPRGRLLASAGDDGDVLIWTIADGAQPSTLTTHPDSALDKETWKVLRCCRSTGSEIYDLAWSPDAMYLLTGSMDHVARIFNVNTGQCIHQLTKHTHYIQGVAWDPLNSYLATTSSDRTVQMYRVDTASKLSVTPYASSSRVDRPSAVGLYHNETLLSFFRRLSFTPDGSLLLVPAGQYKRLGDLEETFHTVYIYTRAGLDQPPVAHVPGHKRPAIAVCCSPKCYTLRNIKQTDESVEKSSQMAPLPDTTSSNTLFLDKTTPDITSTSELDTSNTFPDVSACENTSNHISNTTSIPSFSDTLSSGFSLPYRMIYAVATQDAVTLYDTQQLSPIGILSNFHYATLTDLTWSFDGNALLMTSTDGYCSIVLFDENELGEEYVGLYSLSHVNHSITQKDELKESMNCTSSVIDTVPCLATGVHYIDKNNSFLHSSKEKLPSTAIDVKEKKKRIAPTLVQLFENK